jgi:hypothetical protein
MTRVPGYRIKNGKIEKIDKGSVSDKIQRRKSKRQRVLSQAKLAHLQASKK